MMKRILFILTLLIVTTASAQTRYEYYKQGNAYAQIVTVTASGNFMGYSFNTTATSVIVADPNGGVYHLNCQVVAQGSTTHYYTASNGYIFSTYDYGSSLSFMGMSMYKISSASFDARPSTVKNVENAMLYRANSDMSYGGMLNSYSFSNGQVQGGGSRSSSFGSSQGGSSGYQKQTCVVCHGDGQCRQCTFGNGVCKYCGGKGYNSTVTGSYYKCSNCSGTGKCGSCRGGGKCQTCGGTGKR